MYQLGDLNDEDWHLEAKSTRTEELRFDQKWLDKAHRQAHRLDRQYIALAIQFTTRSEDYLGPLEAVMVPCVMADDLDTLSSLESVTRTKAISLWELADLVPGRSILFNTPKYKLAIITVKDYSCLLQSLKDQTDPENLP